MVTQDDVNRGNCGKLIKETCSCRESLDIDVLPGINNVAEAKDLGNFSAAEGICDPLRCVYNAGKVLLLEMYVAENAPFWRASQRAA